MGMMRRMRDITVATLNDMLESAEDPVRMIDSFLSERKEQINQTEKLLQQVTSHAASLRHQYLDAAQLKDKREQQAMIALRAGEDDIARMALEEKLAMEEKSGQYEALYDQAKRQIIELEDELQRLRAEYQEVYEKRQYYSARLESIRLQQKLNERMKSGGEAGSRMFNRLEERINDLEHETRALRELRTMGRNAAVRVADTMQIAVDRELEALRKKAEQEGWFK